MLKSEIHLVKRKQQQKLKKDGASAFKLQKKPNQTKTKKSTNKINKTHNPKKPQSPGEFPGPILSLKQV